MECQGPVVESVKMKRVLVVEDVAAVRKTIRATLVNAGYEVMEAGDGEEAIRILRDMEAPLTVDVILSDLRMPGTSGPELIAHFRGRYPEIPVVALTGYPDVEVAVSLMRQGVMDFLVKPVLQNELLSVVGRAVGQGSAGPDPVHVVPECPAEGRM